VPTYFRLQELTSVATGSTIQRVEEAVDIGRYATLVVQARKPVAGTGTCTLKLQHAAVLEEAAFIDVTSPTFNLATPGNEVQTFQNLLRYVRWTSTVGTGPAQFLVDVVAREE